MISRRSFSKALAFLPFFGAMRLRAAAPLAFTDESYWVKTPPLIIHKRPPIEGVPGESYIEAAMPACDQFRAGGKQLYLDGVNVTAVAFEADLVGQWVGMFKHSVDAAGRVRLDLDNEGWTRYDASGREIPGSGDVIRYWQSGRVEVRVA